MKIMNIGCAQKLLLAVGACLLPGLAITARAQPVPSPGAVLQQVAPPSALPAAPASPITIAPPAQQSLPANISLTVTDVVITGNRLIPTAALRALLTPLLGRRVKLTELDAAVARITAAYQARGYSLAYAYLPPQSITGGIVQIAVIEPRYDRVFLKGKSRLREGVAKATMGVKSGEPVTESGLERGLLLLNQTPGVRVTGVLIPGASAGTTALQLVPEDEPVLSGTISENDYGSHDTGSYLTSATVSANDAFGYGSSLSINGQLSNTGGLHNGGLQATSPNLFGGIRAGLYGSSTDYHLGSAFAALNENGRATVFGGDVLAPILLAARYTLSLRLDLSDEWLAQSARSVGGTARQTIPAARLSASGAYADGFSGVTSGDLSVSHGDVTIGPAGAKAADAASVKTAGGFSLVQLQLERQQNLPHGFSLISDFSGQLAGRDLDSSQKFYLGGPYGVMSYPVGDGGGDDGYLLSGKLSHVLPVPRLPGVLNASLFAQSGSVRIDHTPYRGFAGGNLATESGAGVGLDYSWRGWTLALAYAHQLGANSAPLVSTRRDQALFQLAFTF